MIHVTYVCKIRGSFAAVGTTSRKDLSSFWKLSNTLQNQLQYGQQKSLVNIITNCKLWVRISLRLKGSNLGEELLVNVTDAIQAGFNFLYWRSCKRNAISKQTFCICTQQGGHPVFSPNTSVHGHFWNHLALRLLIIKQKRQLLVNKAGDLHRKVRCAKPIFLLKENDLVMSEHETVISVWYQRIKDWCFSFSYYLQSSGLLKCGWEWSWPVRPIYYPCQDEETSEKNLKNIGTPDSFWRHRRRKSLKCTENFFFFLKNL